MPSPPQEIAFSRSPNDHLVLITEVRLGMELMKLLMERALLIELC